MYLTCVHIFLLSIYVSVTFLLQGKRLSFTSGEENDLLQQEICNCSRNELDVIYTGVSKNVRMGSWGKIMKTHRMCYVQLIKIPHDTWIDLLHIIHIYYRWVALNLFNALIAFLLQINKYIYLHVCCYVNTNFLDYLNFTGF
jgi:hypothetical protein